MKNLYPDIFKRFLYPEEQWQAYNLRLVHLEYVAGSTDVLCQVAFHFFEVSINRYIRLRPGSTIAQL